MNFITLLKNRYVLIVVSISLLLLLIIISINPSNKKDSVTPINPNSSALNSSSLELVDLSKEKKNQAMIYTASIENKLPISVEGYETSPGIITSINISRGPHDPAEVVRLEITGLSYINKNELVESKNPNLVAFKESYLKAIELLEGQNIDPKRLIFIYGTNQDMRTVARYWVEKLGLL